MTNPFIQTITSSHNNERDRAFLSLTQGRRPAELLPELRELDAFRRATPNLYARVRSALFLHAAYRYCLMDTPTLIATGLIPYAGVEAVRARRFEEAITLFQEAVGSAAPDSALCSALADTYHQLAFQSLYDQVRRSVRDARGNQWMFRIGHADDHPIRLHPAMLARPAGALFYPILEETTPVRLDLSHSGWSDIFFLGMDYPQGARVLNISVDLSVQGRDAGPRPPITTCVRVIPEPVLRLTSVDLHATKDITDLADLFNFGNDYLSLLKAGIIASGVIPPSFEATWQSIADILARVVAPGMGLEVVTRVNDIPKGSRLAVSTNLLASIISALMRATRQTSALEGPLSEAERRLVASRAILGEWLGGSGGGWQDSGGIWPGIKIIEGVTAHDGDLEYGISAGCLLPQHRVLGAEELHPEITERLMSSLVLLHGGLAQNVGPILEIVTEKYLLRSSAEWQARLAFRGIFDDILTALRTGEVATLARLTAEQFAGPLQTIIPWVTNQFTETIIARARERFGPNYWGFLMLGGMSGGGMGMFCAPTAHAEFRDGIGEIMLRTKRELETALPFAIDPVVYTFGINQRGTWATLRTGADAVLPEAYYVQQIASFAREAPESLPYLRRAELNYVVTEKLAPEAASGFLRRLVGHLFHVSDEMPRAEQADWQEEAERIKEEYGFDATQHEQMRADLRRGRIGLAHNRLPLETDISNVLDGDVTTLTAGADASSGVRALQEGRVAVLSLAGGVGSRWTTGAGVIKALHPFVQIAGHHRSFLEIHLAKTRRIAHDYGAWPAHLISTSYLTHAPLAAAMEALTASGAYGPCLLSTGRSIRQRLVPMERDLIFLWEEMPQEHLDVQKEKVREDTRRALLAWTRAVGEGSDYTDNTPFQRFTPPGHWYEVANLLRNGTLTRLLAEHPQVETLLLHNIDTVGASLDPRALSAHLASGNTLTFEVVPRRWGDTGGGLARVNGRLRLLEGLAMPREEDETALCYYNSMTTWIQLDPLLAHFGLTRQDLSGPQEFLAEAVRRLASRVPTYVTIKEVKRRWGYGQEDIFPVAQFEKLWSDMTALPQIACGYLAVPRMRGQQLKEPRQLDSWVRDGSLQHLQTLCSFPDLPFTSE